MVDVLLLKGDSNLSTLIQFTGLPPKSVREALFILIHHSLVLFNPSVPNSSVVFYRLDVEAVLARLSYGHVVARVADKISMESANILLEIIVSGRLNASTILSSSSSSSKNLKDLLSEGLVEVVTTEMCQFSYEASDVNSCENGNKRKLDEETLFPTLKKSKIELSGGVNSKTTSNDIYVRFKAKESALKFYFTEKLVETVTRRLNRTAGLVIEAILNLGSSDWCGVGGENDNLINFNTFQLSQKLPKDLEFSNESSSPASPLLQYLQLLAQNFDYIQVQSSLGANAFTFNFSKALRHLRLGLIESFIRARFGLPSGRIFKILLSKQMFEERQIAKVAMITSKEVRERLYALLKLGLVQLQEVPKSADHAPSRTIFLWSVPERANYASPSKSALFRTFSSKTITGLINLRDLSLLERRKNAQLLEKVERSDVASNLDLLNLAEKKQLADLKKTLKVLNVKIDQVYSEFVIFKE